MLFLSQIETTGVGTMATDARGYYLIILAIALVIEKTVVNPLDSDPSGQLKTGVASSVFLLNLAPSDWQLYTHE